MNWKKVVAVGVLVMIIAFAIYFKGVGVLAILWQLIKENATTIAAVGAIIAVFIAFVVYIGDKKANTYRYLADLYYEILRIGLKYPAFLNPKKTQKYKEAWPSYLYDHDMYIRYDAYARMCWAHAEDIYDVKFLHFFLKMISEDFMPAHLKDIRTYMVSGFKTIFHHFCFMTLLILSNRISGEII